MKKILGLMTILIFILASLTLAQAAGTCTQTVDSDSSVPGSYPAVRVLTFTCTADASDGSFPATALSSSNLQKLTGWFLMAVKTNPGATAPTDNWDFTITDGNAIDMLEGAGANRHTTTSQLVNAAHYLPVTDTWTLNITGNSVNSAIIALQAVFAR